MQQTDLDDVMPTTTAAVTAASATSITSTVQALGAAG